MKMRSAPYAKKERAAAVIPDPRANTEEEALLEISDPLNHFLGSLTPENRKMFILRFWYGMSIREVADRTGNTEAKVQKLLSRLKQRLKKAFREG